MIIAIPSYRRANDCITAKYIKSAVIFCHEFEAEDYREHNENEIVVMSDDLKGKGMAVIRNEILRLTKDDDVLMMDDDVKYVGFYDKQKLIRMSGDDVVEFAKSGFRMCKEFGTVLWGLNLQSDKKFYREYSPFSFSSVVLGPFFGIVKNEKIKFDDSLGLKEDYDYALQVLNKFRKVLRFNKYHYSCAHMDKSGGCANYRTSKKEQEQALAFQKKWGSRIVKIDMKTQGGNMSINPVVNSLIKGI